MGTVGLILVGGFVAYHVLKHTVMGEKDKEFYTRIGRIGLWAIFPPLGFWRSWKHGQRKHDEEFVRLLQKARREEREGDSGSC